MSPIPPNLYVGLMSGTSLDSIDCVLVSINEGKVTLVDALQGDIPQPIRDEIACLNAPADNELYRTLKLSRQLALLFANCVNRLLNKAKISPQHIIAIGSHGQTIRHQPNDEFGFSLQIGDPSTLAEKTGITVIADFRSRDIAAGGQGAPLVPLFHHSLFYTSSTDRTVINIGGIANLTRINQQALHSGFDSGPGNTLLDFWCQKHTQEKFDDKGKWGRQGKVRPQLLESMLEDSYFATRPPKSTGREYFNPQWLSQFSLETFPPVDVMATLTELTALSIVQSISLETQEIFLCGGGTHNSFLVERIQSHCTQPVKSTSALGISPDHVEAIAFAWLADRRINHLHGNSTLSTGARHACVLGAIYSK